MPKVAVKVSEIEEDFIRKNMFLADESFCAGSKIDEAVLIQKAREELGYPFVSSNEIIRHGLAQAYTRITGIRV